MGTSEQIQSANLLKLIFSVFYHQLSKTSNENLKEIDATK